MSVFFAFSAKQFVVQMTCLLAKQGDFRLILPTFCSISACSCTMCSFSSTGSSGSVEVFESMNVIYHTALPTSSLYPDKAVA